MNIVKPKNKPTSKLKDSFASIANVYQISQRWREHFAELFAELDNYNITKKKNTVAEDFALWLESKDREAVDIDVIITPGEKIAKLEKRVSDLEDALNKATEIEVVYKPFMYRKKDDT